jgi:hypothetical protein
MPSRFELICLTLHFFHGEVTDFGALVHAWPFSALFVDPEPKVV